MPRLRNAVSDCLRSCSCSLSSIAISCVFDVSFYIRAKLVKKGKVATLSAIGCNCGAAARENRARAVVVYSVFYRYICLCI